MGTQVTSICGGPSSSVHFVRQPSAPSPKSERQPGTPSRTQPPARAQSKGRQGQCPPAPPHPKGIFLRAQGHQRSLWPLRKQQRLQPARASRVHGWNAHFHGAAAHASCTVAVVSRHSTACCGLANVHRIHGKESPDPGAFPGHRLHLVHRNLHGLAVEQPLGEVNGRGAMRFGTFQPNAEFPMSQHAGDNGDQNGSQCNQNGRGDKQKRRDKQQDRAPDAGHT